MTETVEQRVEKLMNPEEMDIFAYIEGQPLASEKVEIGVNVKVAHDLAKAVEKRDAILEERRRKAVMGKSVDDLSLADDDETTEYDAEIEALQDELSKTALIFELQTVPPKLVRSIVKHYEATAPKDATDEQKEEHDTRMNMDIYRRSIASVRTRDGRTFDKEWEVEDLLALDERFYSEQGMKLLMAMHDIVHIGNVFDQALTPDFS